MKSSTYLKPREAALDILFRVMEEGKDFDASFHTVTTHYALESSDKAACMQLVMLCLRQWGCIGHLLQPKLRKAPKGKFRAALTLLYLGAAEKLWTDHPDYAVVNSMVELAKKRKWQALSGMVNAVLKSLSPSDLDGLNVARLNTPDWWWQRLSAQYGEATAQAIAEAHSQTPPLDISVAPGADTAALQADILPSGSLRLRQAGRVEALPGYAEGIWWVQDAAAALPVRLFSELSGKRALDMCAAPGGKTAQLAFAGAEVTALDASEKRSARLQENLARLSLSVPCVVSDAADYTTDTPFDAVLLDAPCSATGTVRRQPDLPWKRSVSDITRLTSIQQNLLEHAASLTAPGGELVYAVCSLEPEEGEQQIAAFLSSHPEFTQKPANAEALGIPQDWLSEGGAIRTLPCFWQAHGGIDGFYATCLIKDAA